MKNFEPKYRPVRFRDGSKINEKLERKHSKKFFKKNHQQGRKNNQVLPDGMDEGYAYLITPETSPKGPYVRN